MANSPRQPLKAKIYAIISFVGLVGAIATFILFTNSLIDDTRQNMFYYMILCVLGLSVASFLFGAMKSYAKYKGENLPGVLELGGPIVAAALVVYGGSRMMPDRANFNIKTQLKMINGNASDLKDGRLFISDLDLEHKAIDLTDMQVDFSRIPAENIGKKIKFALNVNGYQLAYPDSTYILSADAMITLAVKRDNTLSEIKGRVFDENDNLIAGVIISVGTTTNADTTDNNGVFRLPIPPEEQADSVELFLVKPGYQTEVHTVYPSSKTPPVFKLTKSTH